MELVNVYNCTTRAVTELPLEELAPGMVQCRIEGMPGTYWIKAADVKTAPARHADADIRARFGQRIEAIRKALHEVHPKSYPAWVQGFCRDTHPEWEVEVWEGIADNYAQTVARGHYDRGQRRVVLGLFLSASMASSPQEAVAATNLAGMSPAQALAIVTALPPPRSPSRAMMDPPPNAAN